MSNKTNPNADELFNAQLAQEMVSRTDLLANTEIDLALRVKQAREFIAWSAHHMRSAWEDWLVESGRIAHEMNTFRMTVEREGSGIRGAAKDTRDFFNTPEYVHAHERLKEMCFMLEKFKQFKADGTLDAFADFIIKVTVK